MNMHIVIWKSIHLFWTLNGSFKNHALITWRMSSLSYIDFPNVDIFHYITSNTTLVSIIINLIRKIPKYWETVKFMMVDKSFPKFWSSLKSSTFIMDSKYCCLFFFKWQIHFLHFLCLPDLSSHGFSVGCPFRWNGTAWEAGSFSSWLIARMFSSRQPLCQVHRKSASCKLTLLLHRTWKRCVLKVEIS